MKFIVGFFMAWGNFLTLPCPYKKWDNNLKNMMLAFLPGVGVVVGLPWMILHWVMQSWLNLPSMIISLIMIFYIFAVCGFMHMDGFMDCNDAILSRRSLEERQRILKDSTVGAFAVVTLVFLVLAWFAAVTTAITAEKLWDWDWRLLLIPVLSRGTSGLHVLSCRPVGHSQYVKDYEETGRGRYRIAVVVQMLLVFAVVLIFGKDIGTTIVTALVIALGCMAACAYGRKQLGGMSGDIAGYAICISELAGMLALAIM